MTTDLHTRLVDVVTARLELARAATPGPWRYSPSEVWHLPADLPLRVNGEEFVGAGPLLDAAVCVAATGPVDHPQSTADALHIAASDPATVIRHALADLRRLERHNPVSTANFVALCTYCSTTGQGIVRLADCPEIEDIRLAHAIEIEVPE